MPNKFLKNSKKVLKTNSGFTLVEVLIGIMVLTMSIVATSSFLVSMIKTNVMNTNTIQAYYFTVEGLEAVRNMRDTNFINNVSFCGDAQDNGVDLWGIGGGFCPSGSASGDSRKFAVILQNPVDGRLFSDGAPWRLGSMNPTDEAVQIYKANGLSIENSSTPFTRECETKKYEDGVVAVAVESPSRTEEVDAILVTCTTKWNEGGNDRKMQLSTVLTDWKHE